MNKLLYGREKQKYQHVVEDFYNGVRDLPQVTTQELNKELYKASEVKLSIKPRHTVLTPTLLKNTPLNLPQKTSKLAREQFIFMKPSGVKFLY